jgi:D-proline reductase (dithiol) PrdB
MFERSRTLSSPIRAVDSFRYLSPASAKIVKTMIAMAPRDPVPWTPLARPLSEATVALVSTAGLSMLADRPFDADGERQNPWWGDPSYRVISHGATEADIVASHLHIDTAYLQQDLDAALPLRRLAEAAAEGRIGRVASSHYSFMGYLLDPTQFLERSVPAMIERMRAEGVDAAILVPV